MKKKIDLILPSKDKENFIILPIRIDKDLVQDLIDSGYYVTTGLKVLKYHCPTNYPGAFLFLTYLFLQDLIRFSPFNAYRYFFFLLSIKDFYEQTLTAEQEKELLEYTKEDGDDDE